MALTDRWHFPKTTAIHHQKQNAEDNHMFPLLKDRPAIGVIAAILTLAFLTLVPTVRPDEGTDPVETVFREAITHADLLPLRTRLSLPDAIRSDFGDGPQAAKYYSKT